jgi:DNA primase
VRFDDRFLEELKARLRPSDVIGKSVKLRRQGREYAGLSPFTKEKSPSFFVNDDKGFYPLLLQRQARRHHQLPAGDRAADLHRGRRAAGGRGRHAAARRRPAAAQEREQKRQGLNDWMDLAQPGSADLRRPPGKAARDYLEKRGLPEDQWSRFGLGLRPTTATGLKDGSDRQGRQARRSGRGGHADLAGGRRAAL